MQVILISIKMFVILSLFLALNQLGGHLSCAHTNYCNKSMCPYQGEHVGCGKTKAFGPACKGKPKLIDLKHLQQLILDEHNNYRNMVAAGEVQCFYPATRMCALHWDDELAETAEFNVKTCIFAHDKCRSTKKFPMAGQNIYMTKTKYIHIAIEGFIIEAISLWFGEQAFANHSVVNCFQKTVPQTGHFTLLVCDRQTHVGCALLYLYIPADPDIENDKDRVLIIFTCNYSMTNIYKCPSYKAGPTAVDCKQRSKKFNALCEDRIDCNDLKWYKRS